MKRIKIMGLALVALFAMSAMTSSAFAKESKNLVIRDPSGIVSTGTVITASSTNLVTVTSAGNLECEHAELPATLTSNNAKDDLGSSTEDLNFGDYDGIPGACKTSAAGPAIITTSAFPWSAEFTDKGVEEEKGSKDVTFTSEFLALSPPDNKCQFTAAKIESTFPVGKEGHPVNVEFTTKNQKFKLNSKAAGTAPICPKEGLLSGNWNVTDAAGQVTDEL